MSPPWSLASGLRKITLASIAPVSKSSELTHIASGHQRPVFLQSGRSESIENSATPLQKLEGDAISVVALVAKLTMDVMQAVSSVPYVGAIAGIVDHLIQIREELQTQKDRCEELLDRVFRKISKVFGQLLKLKDLDGKGKFDELAVELGSYHAFLKQVVEIITRVQYRGAMERILDRGVDDLEKLDRMISNFDSEIISTMVMHLITEVLSKPQATSASSPMISSDVSTLLPPGPVCMLEREGQRDELVNALISSQNSKVAILGMGGIGKTTLACSAMKDLRIVEEYPRRYFVSFEGLPTSDLVYTSLANTFQVPPDHRTSENQILSQLLIHLGQKKTLLCLDNFETFWEATESRRKAEELLGHLSSLGSLAILVTLRGTERPGGTDWVLLDPLRPLNMETSESLISRISHLSHEDGNEKEYIRKLLDAMGGLPLAVTLIANLLRDRNETPESLWERWREESTSIIRTSGSDDKQYQLNVSLRLSVYGPRMDQNARDALAAIAVLPVGLSNLKSSLDDLQSHLPSEIRLRDCIRTLRNVALCSLDESSSPPRLQLLSPVRQFCNTNLPPSNKVIDGLIDFYNHRMASHKGLGTSADVQLVSSELSNVDAVIRHAYSIGRITTPLVWSTMDYVQWMGHLGSTTYEILEIAVAALPERSTNRAKCLDILAGVYLGLGRSQEACNILHETLEIHRAVQSPKRDEVYTLTLLGQAYFDMGESDEAEAVLKEGLEAYKDSDDPLGAANIFHSLAWIHIWRDNLEETESFANQALELRRTCGDRLGEANVLHVLGLVHHKRKQFSLSAKTFQEAIDASKDTNYTYGQGDNTYWLGRTFAEAQDFKRAVTCFEQAIPLYEQAHATSMLESAKEMLESSRQKLISEPEGHTSLPLNNGPLRQQVVSSKFHHVRYIPVHIGND